MVSESTSRQKMLLNVLKHPRKQHSHLSLDFAPKMSLHAPYCTTKYHAWNNGNKTWQRRKQGQVVPEQEGIRSSGALGRVYTVHPTNSECFHLRFLLHEGQRPMSFTDLRTFDGRVCETYKQACQLRGLLEDVEHWNKALEEAAASRSPKILRNLFAVMLQICSMSSPKQLWMDHKENLSEDILHKARIQQQNMDLDYCEAIFNRALIDIEDKIILLGGSDLKSFGLPQPN
ncbi:hypothetical protein AVEN_14835-1 [Araneus ventricosus]|uniref:Helitron helicase-like domain-containing protein n=2 Tax=Araneus ventricosus TaxID=182803 RepID=A0A4Y2UKT4_ARAVE|nr:hypothetical protein AVEN_7556-1 [Araneus ventricosus]GBO12170.1 hypothetical protein AVEN_14835-1 [Araneus ventricosus]